jgi:trigger factor
MKTDVETLGPTRVKLTVEVPFDELRPSVDAAYKKISQQVRVKGFRPGRVPPALIDRQVGRGLVLEEAVNEALPRFYGDAVRERDVRAIGRPEVEVTEFTDGAQLVFTAEVDVRPELVLPAYGELTVTVEPAEPTEAEIDEQLAGMRDRFATLSTVERPAADGDYVTIDVSGIVDGEPVEELASSGMSYLVGSGTLIDGLDAAIIGRQAGEQATFETALRDGRTAAVEVTVRSVKEKELPALDEEFARTASEFDTLEELRADLRERLVRVKRLTQGAQARERALAAVLEGVEVALPERLLEEEITARREALNSQLGQAGITPADYLAGQGRTEESLTEEISQAARESIRSQLVLDEIARREQLDVTEAELSDQVVRRAGRIGMPAQDYARELVAHGQLPVLMAEVLRGKALAFVLEHSQIVDSSGNPVDLAQLTV